MTVSLTSRQAYDPGAMASLRMTVYETIKDCPMLSNRDLARILEKEPSTISGRTNELAEEGLIKAWTTKKDPTTGKTVKVWEAVA